MASTDERRQNQRFPLELPMEVNWRGEEGEKNSETKALDISSSGVYFYLPEKLEDKGKIEFYVRLHEPDSSVPGIYLHCLGSIICVDGPDEIQDEKKEHSGQVGVAVHIDRYRFLRPDEKMPQAPKQPA